MNYCPKRSVHPKVQKTVSIKLGGAGSYQLMIADAVAINGTKLALFFIFKGQPEKKWENHSLTEHQRECLQQFKRERG